MAKTYSRDPAVPAKGAIVFGSSYSLTPSQLLRPEAILSEFTTRTPTRPSELSRE